MEIHALAAVFAVTTTAPPPVQHWYTEDSKSSTCVTLETAHRDIGVPYTRRNFSPF